MIGIHNVQANLQDQLISVEGTAAPSKIVAAIQDTGRDAVLRGTGKAESMPSGNTHNPSLSDLQSKQAPQSASSKLTPHLFPTPYEA